MKTKICTKCEKEKSIKEFAFRNKAKNIRHTQCKSCKNVAIKAHYQRNKKDYKRRARDWTKRQRELTADYKYNYKKEHPCVDCGETDPRKLEFDHVNDDKAHNVGEMTDHSLKKIKEEIDKCQIRCANCHRVKTAEENNWHDHIRYLEDQKNLKKT